MAQRSDTDVSRHRDTPVSPLMLSISGCRGIVGATMTPATVCRYVAALSVWLSEDCSSRVGDAVVLARDGRRGGDVFAHAAAAQLQAAGYRVIDLGVAATPTVGVAVVAHEAAGGVIITASHNPAQWNGIKPINGDGRAPTPKQAERILEFYHNEKPVALQSVDRLGAYSADGAATHMHVAKVLNALAEMAPIDAIKARKFTVAIDSVNASGRVGARLLMDALGCELVHLYTDETGDFPHAPEPTRENLSGAGGLADAVREHGCEVGFAQDPDADRLAIIDEAGAYIGEEYTLALTAWAILSSSSSIGGTTLAANLSTSRLIDDVAGQYGATVLRTAVGEANVAQALDDHNGLFGGEGNGGVIWPDVVMIRDSLTAMALTLALMTRTGKTVSQLVSSLETYSIVKEKSPIEPGASAQAVEAVAAHWKTARLNRLDGVRIDLEDQRAWLHVRPSNTEPILRFIAEAPDESTAHGLIDEARRAIASAKP